MSTQLCCVIALLSAWNYEQHQGKMERIFFFTFEMFGVGRGTGTRAVQLTNEKTILCQVQDQGRGWGNQKVPDLRKCHLGGIRVYTYS